MPLSPPAPISARFLSGLVAWPRTGSANVLVVFLLAFAACSGSGDALTPLDEGQAERIIIEVRGRSFRQIDPSKDGNPRKGVIIDFFGENRIGLGAQFADVGRAIQEWEIVSEDFELAGMRMVPR